MKSDEARFSKKNPGTSIKYKNEAGLSKKILDHPQNTKMWSKWHFFDFFSKTALTILTKLTQKVELINSEPFPKTAYPKKFPFSRYSSTKSRFWPKNAKSGVQRSCYISRTVNATKNLIWYSESTINFLSSSSHQIFTYLSSSWRKFDSKTGNFHVFYECFFDIFSPTTWNILMKLG